MKKIITLFLALTFSINAQQDLKLNYAPLKSTGELPTAFTQNIRDVIKKDITELKNKKDEDRGLKSTFVTASNYEIEKIIRSGNTLINDEITIYLNKIADLVLKGNPNLRKQLNIFTLKSSVVNAYSYDKGYIFIDIGLIAQAETEAQLAYIICHEISHYTKQHHINSYVKNAEIDRRDYYGKSSEDRIIEKCQYSKENESEADIEGFKLFERTPYNLKQAEKSFDMLQYAHLPFELMEFNKTYFESENYVLPKTYFLTELASIKDNSNEDDTKHTHPNTKKRKQAIAEIVSNRDNTNRINSAIGQEKFDYIRDLSRFELCRLYLKNRDYPNALYAAYIMSLKYPSNEYLAEVVSKCLYAIALYNKSEISYTSNSYLNNGLPGYKEIESYPQQLYYLISKMPENEWTVMSLNYVYRAHKKYPNNKALGSFSDSLFNLIKRTKWGLGDFARAPKKVKEEVKQDSSTTTIQAVPKELRSKTDLIASLQKERMTAGDDTVYYKEVFVDLLVNDNEFKEKFPSSGSTESLSRSGFSSYNSYKSATRKNNIKTQIKVEKVLLLEPYFIKIDETKKQEIQYVTSDKKQEDYSTIINKCAESLNFELITIDPAMLSSKEVDKINDYSVINDWFDEKFDTDKEKNIILNTDDIATVIAKYGTQYVLKTGVATIVTRSARKITYFYGFLFDVKSNELVYRKYEYFKTKDRKDLVNAKTYQMLYELKHPIKK
ncbi:M48 family metallopeptidase [Aurantibacillus circumpalustris]|uniref:M48 family metallopeptidase n=1 Tax=Aurantibacillus circumpalustris TaxID=3036359 RepID=UPI00295A5ACF|nr:M48 family metallopeptidase [Aurantibacillus circumpalustris]